MHTDLSGPLPSAWRDPSSLTNIYTINDNPITYRGHDGPTTLRLIQIDEHDNVAEEAVFSVQGILSVKNLPPITEKIK